MAEDVYDFIVVGGGAAGCVLASRLARNDRDLKVLLIEAGNEHADLATYQVPAFHALASENPRLRWDFFVDHFTDPSRHRDEKASARGIFYPRASAHRAPGLSGRREGRGRDPRGLWSPHRAAPRLRNSG